MFRLVIRVGFRTDDVEPNRRAGLAHSHDSHWLSYSCCFQNGEIVTPLGEQQSQRRGLRFVDPLHMEFDSGP